MCFPIGMEAPLDFGNDCLKLGVSGGILSSKATGRLPQGKEVRVTPGYKCLSEMANLWGGEGQRVGSQRSPRSITSPSSCI